MCAHREVLNAPLLPRSCAKCCFGCIPAIDRSLAGGGEMAAGRDCASFNEFILLYPAQTACGYTISPSKENLSLPCLGPHGQPPVFLTLHATALNLLLRALLLLWLQVLYLRAVNFALFLNDPHVAFPKSGFNYLISASYWLSPMKWRPCCLLCSWSTKGHYLSLVLSPGRVYKEMKIVLFQGCVTVRGFKCSFAKGIPIINI